MSRKRRFPPGCPCTRTNHGNSNSVKSQWWRSLLLGQHDYKWWQSFLDVSARIAKARSTCNPCYRQIFLNFPIYDFKLKKNNANADLWRKSLYFISILHIRTCSVCELCIHVRRFSLHNIYIVKVKIGFPCVDVRVCVCGFVCRECVLWLVGSPGAVVVCRYKSVSVSA